MILHYNLTCKNFEKDKKFAELFNHLIDKLEAKLANYDLDLPHVTVILKKHEKNHFFSGLITLTLPKKSLIATMSGHSEIELLHSGFDKLFKEFETYKAKHFKGSSKYRDHTSSIRASVG